ncbi:hypothetical protein OU798_09750 [Prolixibacteraceae bacterium Z1-6]|uniref:DUF3575 domain-containing protein n=1 Tax=Draconibacterium aestuarii TaxID=2998507 RepID=A0A9X3F8B3_9BACT|nr:hypothetical protein [Prolixibacteraceae bacterium Z1-6]
MKTLPIILLLFCTLSTFAQDRIIKKNSDVIECKVTEMASAEVKYFYPDNPKLIFGIDNALVERIEFGTGEVVQVGRNTFDNPEYYAEQSKNALKINFLSPLFGTTELVYERNIKPGQSWETALGIVGLGNDVQDINPGGIYGKFAYKFLRNPDFYMNRMHYSHLLKGAYIAPEIALRYMSYDSNTWDYYYDSNGNFNDTYSESRESQLTLAIMLKFGKQWVFDDAFLVDVYCGVGYGIGADDYDGLPYGFIVAPDDFPIALTSGIRIGWVFGK